MPVNWVKLKKSTITLLTLIASGTLSIQVDWVKNHVIPQLANHPHLSTLGGGLIILLTLLHEPKALEAIEGAINATTDTPSEPGK